MKLLPVLLLCSCTTVVTNSGSVRVLCSKATVTVGDGKVVVQEDPPNIIEAIVSGTVRALLTPFNHDTR